MRRMLLALLIICFLAFPIVKDAIGAGSMTQHISCTPGGVTGGTVGPWRSAQCTVEIGWTAGTSGAWTAAALDSSIIKNVKEMFLYLVETKVGSPVPLNGYAVTLSDAYGRDTLGGALGSCSNTTIQQRAPIIDDDNRTRAGAPIQAVDYPGTTTPTSLTLNITGAGVTGSKGTIILRFKGM